MHSYSNVYTNRAGLAARAGHEHVPPRRTACCARPGSRRAGRPPRRRRTRGRPVFQRDAPFWRNSCAPCLPGGARAGYQSSRIARGQHAQVRRWVRFESRITIVESGAVYILYSTRVPKGRTGRPVARSARGGAAARLVAGLQWGGVPGHCRRIPV